MRRGEPMWRRYARFFGPDVRADVDEELADHVARLEDDLRRAGKSDAEIAEMVRARFGDVDDLRAWLTRYDGRRLKRSLRIEAFGNLGQDVAYALRRLRQRPGFTATVVVVLALGVGATTAMFSAVDATMLRPLPFKDPGRLVAIPSLGPPSYGTTRPHGGSSSPEPGSAWDRVSHAPGILGVGAYYSSTANLSDPERPARVNVGHATAGFFRLLGIRPFRGGEFTASEAAPNAPGTAILSYGFWRQHFGGRDMLGRAISLDGKPYSVVGIMPAGFSFPDESDLWIPVPVPFPPIPLTIGRPTVLKVNAIARLAPGISIDRVNAELYPVFRAMVPEHPPAWMKLSLAKLDETARHSVQPLQASFVGKRRTVLLTLLGATACLLLIACANVTNLLLSQAEVRRREIALRAVLGAGRGRLIRQLLTESLILSLAGTAIGVALAPVGLRVLTSLMPPVLVGLAPPEVDLRVLAFAVGLALLAGVGFGLWPALATSRNDLADSVRGAGVTGTTTQVRGRARRALLTAEFALTLVLAVGAGLMLQSFARLTHVDPGFNPARTASLELDFGWPPPPMPVRKQPIRDMLARLATAPGVEAAGAISVLPLGGGSTFSLTLGGEGVAPRPKSMRPRFAEFRQISGDYFAAMGIRLVQGRAFTAADDSMSSESGYPPMPRVAIVSESVVDSLWGHGYDPVGRWIQYGSYGPSGGGPHMTVVGVVEDVRSDQLEKQPLPQVYVPAEAAPPTAIALIARGSIPPRDLEARLRNAVHGVDPSQAVFDVRTMDDVVRASIAVPRTDTLLIATFGALALVLAVVGVYGVIAYSVAQRRREFGIRAALGATGSDLLALVSREMLWVTAIGLALGLAGAWAASRALQSLLFGVTVHDPATFVLAPLALVVPAAIATLLPARRAARTNPVDVIREE